MTAPKTYAVANRAHHHFTDDGLVLDVVTDTKTQLTAEVIEAAHQRVLIAFKGDTPIAAVIGPLPK